MKLEARAEIAGVMERAYLIITLPNGNEKKVILSKREYDSLRQSA